MKIGIIISRIGGIDGVGLETEKWIDVLKEKGHEVFIFTGESLNQFQLKAQDYLLPILSFFSKECLLEQELSFYHPENNPQRILSMISKNANNIAESITNWCESLNINLLILENVSTLPSHLSLGLGVKLACEKIKFPVISHNHDFSWERGSRYQSVHKEINEMIKEVFPLILPNVQQVVINENGKHLLKNKFSTNSIKIPNVMDFDKPFANKQISKKNVYDFFNLPKNNILLFQITRIVRRKRIDTALELISKLNDKNIKLIIAGDARDDYKQEYLKELLNQTEELNIKDKVIFAQNIFHRKVVNEKSFSIEDAYYSANACTYFSDYEGFGNAFVETILAKKPIFVNNYKPVYEEDIKIYDFKAVTTEDNKLTEENVKEIKNIIYDKKLAIEISEENFAIGKKYFSYNVLRDFFDTIK